MNPQRNFQPIYILMILSLLLLLAPEEWNSSVSGYSGTSTQLSNSGSIDPPFHSQNATSQMMPNYVEHDPIYITKNSDFVTLGFPGEGSANNPYLIEGLNITNPARFHFSIDIRETTVYFQIRNNWLNGLTNGSGIFLSLLKNGMIDHNLMINCATGIGIQESENITISNNTILNCTQGIQVSSRYYTIVSHNVLSNCAISIDALSNTIISHNMISGGGSGIFISMKCTVAHNLISNSSSRVGIFVNGPKNNITENQLTHCGVQFVPPHDLLVLQGQVENNTINNHPLIFWRDINGGKVPKDAKQVILVNTRDIEITELDISNVPTGILTANCSGSNIHHNQIANIGMGIIFLSSHQSVISHNNISNFANIASPFPDYYDQYQYAQGLHLSDSENNTIIQNNISNFLGDGIRLVYSSNSNISYNTISNGKQGISFINSENNTIIGNQLSNTGFVFTSIHQAVVKENIVNQKPVIFWQHVRGDTVPTDVGQVFLVNCTQVEVTGQRLSNGSLGILGVQSSNLRIHHNFIFNNAIEGITLRACQNSSISYNFVRNNGIGILLDFSSHNNVTQNVVAQNVQGISFKSSSRNQLTHSCISQSQSYGVSFDSFAEGNLIAQNDFLQNNLGGSSQAEDLKWQTTVNSKSPHDNFTRNYWDDHINTDTNRDGIVDLLYMIAGSSNRQDIAPLPTPANPNLRFVSPPVIRYPNGGEAVQGTVTIQWIPAVDSFGQLINYTLAYSTNGGSTWTPIVVGLRVTHYKWNTTLVADGGPYQIRVAATTADALITEDSSTVPFSIQNLVATTTSLAPRTTSPILEELSPLMVFESIILLTLALLLNPRKGSRH